MEAKMADSRQTILNALRQGVAVGPALPLPEVAAPVVESLPEGDAAWELFRTGLSRVRVDLHVAKDADQAGQFLLDVAKEFFVRKAALWQRLPLDAAQMLGDAGVEIVYAGQGGCQDFADAGLGVTGVEAALVKTGTLLVRAGTDTPRGASLLPPVHLALVERSKLLPSVLVLPEIIRKQAGNMPSAFHTITGPSSTSDIELTPVFGVHGPTTVRVIGLDF